MISVRQVSKTHPMITPGLHAGRGRTTRGEKWILKFGETASAEEKAPSDILQPAVVEVEPMRCALRHMSVARGLRHLMPAPGVCWRHSLSPCPLSLGAMVQPAAGRKNPCDRTSGA